MAIAASWRQGAIFASGLLLGAAVAAWAVLETRSPPAAKPEVSTSAKAALPRTEQPMAARPAQGAACPQEAVVASAGADDAQFDLLQDLSGNAAGDTAAFILVGKEAAAAGRPRDAEVAFLMSCRIAHRFHGADSSESADAKYQLGRHYANVALDAQRPAGANRPELLRRAELLYEDSLGLYRARHGESHEKSRFAAQGLVALRQTLAQAPAPAPVAVPAAPTARAQPAPARSAVQGPAEQPVRQPTQASRPRPSFDCAKARSVPERMICADAELATLDRELGRLHARAKSSAPNPAAFKRQNDHEWKQREANCRDRGCLLEWYAQRREQLLDSLNEARETQPTALR